MTGTMPRTRGKHPATREDGSKAVRICMISDTHTMHDKIHGMQKADILLHAGDITYHGKYEELLKFSDWLDSLERNFPGGYKHKVIIPGNHDKTFEDDWETAAAHVTGADAILNQETYEACGLTIYGEPRQPWFYDWAFNVQRSEMRAVWDKAPKCDVLLTHGPPLGVGDRCADGANVGCKYQREWILDMKPQLVVCGHIHEGYGIYKLGETLIVNASICTRNYRPDNPPIVITL